MFDKSFTPNHTQLTSSKGSFLFHFCSLNWSPTLTEQKRAAMEAPFSSTLSTVTQTAEHVGRNRKAEAFLSLTKPLSL
jgi:hypothetical protein